MGNEDYGEKTEKKRTLGRDYEGKEASSFSTFFGVISFSSVRRLRKYAFFGQTSKLKNYLHTYVRTYDGQAKRGIKKSLLFYLKEFSVFDRYEEKDRQTERQMNRQVSNARQSKATDLLT